jgi:hypothetical protein
VKYVFVNWKILLGKKDRARIGWQSLGSQKKTHFASFPNCLLKTTWIKSMFLYALLLHHGGGKTKHHWGSIRNKCQSTTLYRSCIRLSNGKWNVTYTSCRRVLGMRLYNRRQQKPKWKDPRTSNVETHVQAHASEVEVREGIK